MYKNSVKRRFVTLIEMMIVMFLIALITGVIAYNYRGSLDEGKVFKTKAGIQKIETILNLELAKNPENRDRISSEWKNIVSHSPIVHDANALVKDGWGEDYKVSLDDQGNIKVESSKLHEYQKTHNTLFEK